MENQSPDQKQDKRAAVETMFDSIAWRYDFLNHFLSVGIDRLWRKSAIRIISGSYRNPYILDVATGTGDLAIAAVRIHPKKITGIDISQKMLEVGRAKIEKMGLTGIIDLVYGDSETIPFDDKVFNVAMVAFGVRNFSDPVNGLTEMYRVLIPGGMILVLEFSKPTGFPFRHIFNFYFRNILPLFGKLVSRNKAAYNYLPESVMNFPDNEDFLELLIKAGFTEVQQKKMTGGVASIYTGIKK